MVEGSGEAKATKKKKRKQQKIAEKPEETL